MILQGTYDHEALHLAGATFARALPNGTTEVLPETFDAGLIPAAQLQLAKIKKAAILRYAANLANQVGFISTALDGVTQYRYSTDNVFGDSAFDGIDMLTLIAAHSHAAANLATVGFTVSYPAKGPSDLTYKKYTHTAAQMKQVGEAGIAFMQANRDNLRTKLLLVAAASTVEQVNAITW
jgi:hypothetical protein